MIILDNNSEAPLYAQIYEQLKQEIVTGILPEGSRLPSTRHLAQTLAVGRNTVEYAYLQLSSEGYVTSRVGSGFTVEKLNGFMYLTNKKDSSQVEQSSTQDKEPSNLYPYHSSTEI